MSTMAAVTISPMASYPPTPPNTLVDGLRSRTNSTVSTGAQSAAPSSSDEISFHPSILINGGRLRRMLVGGVPRNLAHVDFAAVLDRVEEENPGQFYELDTTVPNNTPCATEEPPSSPRSQAADKKNGDLDVEELGEMLNGVPSKASSPAPSVFGGTQSSCSEPLYMALAPRRTPKFDHSPLSTVNNINGSPYDNNKPSSPFKDLTSSFESVVTITGPGVMEYNDWADQIEYDVLRGFQSLANLANDDYQKDPSISKQKHYNIRVHRMLNHEALDMKFDEIVKEIKEREERELKAQIAEVLRPKVDDAADQKDAHVQSHISTANSQDVSADQVAGVTEKVNDNLYSHEAELKKLKLEQAKMKAQLDAIQKLVMQGSECTTKMGDDEAGGVAKKDASS